MRKEMDGCLPLEKLCSGKMLDWWANLVPGMVLQLNSGRAAIYACVLDFIVRHGEADTVWIPLYLCDTVKNFLEAHQVTIKEYNLKQDYTPDIDEELFKSNDIMVWPNYFGCMPQIIVDGMADRYKERLIIDNTQAFFAEPRLQSYNVYSCRKFVGVADGSVAIHEAFALTEESLPFAPLRTETWQAPVETSIYGSNHAYKAYLENGKAWEQDFGKMSPLTQAFLEAVDYQDIQKRRICNFKVLHNRLKEVNLITDVDFTTTTAFRYPFLVKNKGLRDYLHAHNVFVTRWWKRAITHPCAVDKERELAEYLYPLAIDQRYDEQDMNDLADLILDYLKAQ